MLGDINRDGQVDAEDLQLLKTLLEDLRKHDYSHSIIGQMTPEQRALLDINGDGNFSYDDVIALCKLVVKETESHPGPLSQKLSALQDRIRHKT